MKKFTAIILILMMAFGLLSGCGSKYEAEESTVFILKDGTIVSTDVEEFDEEKYDEKELEAYVNDTIDEYAKEYGKKAVKLKDVSVSDGKATLILEYAKAEDYERFYGIELFTGSISEALSAGYTFDADFAQIEDGAAKPCSKSAFFDNDDYKVAVIKANTRVKIKGTIAYVSAENVTLVDDSTVAIQNGNNLFSQEEAAQGTESASETVNGTENDAQSADGSVGDDELEIGTEASTEVVFDFDEEPEQEDSEFSTVYTYIIYK